MKNIADRIQFLSLQYKSIRKFALSCDIDPTTMLSYVGSGKRKVSDPTGEALRKIVLTTGCNGHWLLTGLGTIYLPLDLNSQPINENILNLKLFSNNENEPYIKYPHIPKLKATHDQIGKLDKLKQQSDFEYWDGEELLPKIEKYLTLADAIAEQFRNKPAIKKIKQALLLAAKEIWTFDEEDSADFTTISLKKFIANRLCIPLVN